MVYGAVAVASVIPIALGLLVATRSRQRLIGWLLVAQGLSVGTVAVPELTRGSAVTLVVDQLAQGSWIFLFLWTALAAYVVPDGRALSRFWRRWIFLGLGGALLFLVGAAGDRSGFREGHGGQDPPLAWVPEPAATVIGVVGLVLVVTLLVGSAVAVVSRLRRAMGAERLQLLWLVWGALAVPFGLLMMWLNHFVLGGPPWLTYGTLAAVSVALPATIAIAILRHQLFDIELVLSRTLIYGGLVGGVAAAYALVVLFAERLGGSGTTGGVLAVVVVALAMQPLHSWLRKRAERWVYGYRAQPHRALRLLAERVDAAEPEALVGAVTAAVAEALRVDKVWIEPAADDTDERLVRSPLIDRGHRLGDLVVEIPRGRRLVSADLSLLRDLARYAAVLVRSEQRRDQLRESRAHIVVAREEERRRLRRDLHDGVGPSLAAIVLKLDAAKHRSDRGDQLILVAEAREEVREAIAEVRRLVENLRPPAIDEVGLLDAIRQRAATLSEEVLIDVAGPDPMPALPAAVEVAVFRIASEAMTNVARHARATRCRVDLSVNGRFELTVADNGEVAADRGDGTARGTGWTSMRERAAELGGSCTISGRPEGGMVVHATMPIERDPADGDRPSQP